MPTTDPAMQHIVTTVRDTANRYGVTDGAVTEIHRQLQQRPVYSAGHINGHLTALLVQIADQHHADCYRADCATCEHLREALTIRLADITAGPRPWWARLLHRL